MLWCGREPSLNILITNRVLRSGSGTETVACDLALELRRQGHEAAIYSPLLGTVAEHVRERGIPVFDDIRQVSPIPDVVHGHHHAQTLTALLQFPKAKAVFACHDATAWHDEALIFPRVLRYVAVDHRCLKRFAEDLHVSKESIRVIFNAVDLSRFRPRPGLPEKPARAAIFSNYATPFTHTKAVAGACQSLGITVDVIGSGANSSTSTPETALLDYDIVFAKARCALEALAVGSAVILCDFAGLGALVTRQNFAEFRKLNFGTGNLTRPLDPHLIMEEIKRYDPQEAACVSERTRSEANLTHAAMEWIELYHEILQQPYQDNHTVELAATAEYLVKWGYDARIALETASMKKLTHWPILGRCFHWVLERERSKIVKLRDVPRQR